MKAIINAKIYDYENFIEEGYILYDRQIIAVGPMSEYSGKHEAYDAQGKLILPGLLNGHTHIYSALFRGSPLVASPENFTDVLKQVWWHFDKQLDLEAIQTSAYVYARECMKHGVTALIDHHASGVIQKSLLTLEMALTDMGIKHLLCFETSDRFDMDACIRENLYAVRQQGHFGFHASMSLSEDSLSTAKAYVKDHPIHIHVAESLDDVVDCKDKYGMPIVHRLQKHGLLNKDSILGHCVHIDEEEAELIKEHGCYVAINPTSNLNNAVGLYNCDLLKRHDLQVLVGTDGLGANVAKEYQYLYYVGKQQLNHPSSLDLNFVKQTITRGYEYFNKLSKRRIGRIAKGYDADMILLDYDFLTPMNQDNVFGHILFGVFENMHPMMVWIDGEKEVDQYKVVQNDKGRLEDVLRLWGRL